MTHDDDQLPGDVKALLAAEKERFEVPGAARDRLAIKLAATVPAFGPSPALPGAHGLSSLPARLLATAGGKALVALALVGAALGSFQATRARPVSSAVSTATHAPVEAPAPPLASEVPSLPTVPAPEAPRVPAPPPRAEAPRARASAATSDVATLAEERRLLEAARDAVQRGEPSQALTLTATHASRFPHGALTEERQALRIRALARLAKVDPADVAHASEARAVLATFRAEFPHSFLLEAATEDVASIP